MIKDIDFAFFSQLAYLNWNNLSSNKFTLLDEYIDKNFIKFLSLEDRVWNKIKTPFYDDRKNLPKVKNDILMYHEEDKRLFGVFGTERNKENSQLMNPLYNFDGWQFIYSADKTKLYKDKYNFNNVVDDGFFAAAFMKDDDIVIAYRGTETTLKDFLADLEIGFFNRNHSQLVSTYLFLEHIKSLYPNKTINITGHSLGGCLAQYAFVCSGKKYSTITWNGLGLGKHKHNVTKNLFFGNDITNYLALYSFDIKSKLEKSLFSTDGSITDDFLKLNETQMIDIIFNKLYKPTKETIETGYHKLAETEIGDLKMSAGVTSSDRNREDQKLNSHQDEDLKKELKLSSIQIYWLLRSIKNYQLAFSKDSDKITNFYNSLDWTANLQTREGKCIDVLTGTETLKEEVNDSKSRIINETISNAGINYHGVNDFLLYMDSNGMIQTGKYNLIFTKNLVKTLYDYVKNTDSQRKSGAKYLDIFVEGTSNKTEKKNPFEKFHVTCSRPKLFCPDGPKISIIDEANIKYVTSAIKSLKPCVIDYINYREYSKEEKEKNFPEIAVYTIGHLSNVDNLAGIKGELPTQLIKIDNTKPEEKVVAKAEPKEEDKYRIKEGNATVTVYHLC